VKKRPAARPAAPASSSQKLVSAAPADTVTPCRRSEVRPAGRTHVNLKALNFEKLQSVPISGDRFNHHEIEAENKMSGSVLNALRLKCSDPESKIWEVVFTSKITAVTSSDSQTAVACDDNSISVFVTETGRRLHPPIAVDAPAALLLNTDVFLLVITTNAHMYLWDMVKRQSLLRQESLLPLFCEGNALKSDLQITTCSISDCGTPVVTMSNKKSYAYDLRMSCWSVIADPCDLTHVCSDIRQPRDARHDPGTFPLASLQHVHRSARTTSSVFQSNSSLHASATISLLDQQLASAFVLGSATEYKFWLMSLTQALTDASREDRLRELCTFLLGPVYGTASPADSQILGLDKRQLLNDVLVIMTSNMRLQRLYSEIKDQLNEMRQQQQQPQVVQQQPQSQGNNSSESMVIEHLSESIPSPSPVLPQNSLIQNSVL
jgi:protein HIRA/HIR1